MGRQYAVSYLADMVKADIDRRTAVWGQIDFHTRTIRVYRGFHGRQQQPIDMLVTLIHEILHGILQDAKLLAADVPQSRDEAWTDHLATLVADTLVRNGLVGIPGVGRKGGKP